MKQTFVISSPTCFGWYVPIIRELQCAWLKLRMSLYVEIVQIVQRQSLAEICRQIMAIRISFYLICNHRYKLRYIECWTYHSYGSVNLQEPVVCGLVAGLCVSVLCHCDSGIRASLYKGFRPELLCSARNRL
jgi:hypothetical protein